MVDLEIPVRRGGLEAEGPDLCAVSPPATRGRTQLALDVVLDAEDCSGGEGPGVQKGRRRAVWSPPCRLLSTSPAQLKPGPLRQQEPGRIRTQGPPARQVPEDAQGLDPSEPPWPAVGLGAGGRGSCHPFAFTGCGPGM